MYYTVNGELEFKQETKEGAPTFISDYYTDYSVPVKTYYQLRNYVAPAVTVDYSYKVVKIKILGKWEERSVPYEILAIAN